MDTHPRRHRRHPVRMPDRRSCKPHTGSSPTTGCPRRESRRLDSHLAQLDPPGGRRTHGAPAGPSTAQQDSRSHRPNASSPKRKRSKRRPSYASRDALAVRFRPRPHRPGDNARPWLQRVLRKISTKPSAGLDVRRAMSVKQRRPTAEGHRDSAATACELLELQAASQRV